MRNHAGRPRLTLIELVLVMTVVATLATLLCPVLARSQPEAATTEQVREEHYNTCASHLRQVAMGIAMYVQDNGGRYPGMDKSSWVSKVSPYFETIDVFECPADPKAAEGQLVSYGLSGLLVRHDGTGVKEAQVYSPSEVGATCDANPTDDYPNGRVVGGGGMLPAEMTVLPAPRHNGIVVGFCDGHVKLFRGSMNIFDEGNGAVRALFHAAPLGLIDNPAAMLTAGTEITGLTGTLTVGGEYAASPFLMAAAKVYGSYYTAGCKGQLYTQGRPQSAWVWGTASSGPEKVAPRAMAYDALCIVVAKGSKIPTLPIYDNGTYAMAIPAIRELFETGYQQDVVQVYQLPDACCSTNAYMKQVIGNTDWGTDSIMAANDAEMVERVANDPYGIGYCSSAFADPARVTVLAPVIDGKIYVWPRADEEFRWVMPTFAESDWPWKRSLDVVCSPDKLGNGIATALRTGAFVKQGLYQGPLFTWGYWPGNY